MPRVCNLTERNDHGDNGWWKISDREYAHYFQDKRPTCGWSPIDLQTVNLKCADRFDRKCKNCTKVRRNRLIIRMNATQAEVYGDEHSITIPFSHSPRKPQ